jgi:hypothetical protein
LNPTPPSYRSDAAGLICGFILGAASDARPVDADEAAAWLANVGDDGAVGGANSEGAFASAWPSAPNNSPRPTPGAAR